MTDPYGLIAKSPSDLKTLTRRLRGEQPPVVRAYQLTGQQWIALLTLSETGSVELASGEAGARMTDVMLWSMQDWWKELWEAFVQLKQSELQARMLGKLDDLMLAWADILAGDPSYNKLATAVVKSLEMVSSMGDNPLLKRGPRIVKNVQNNYQQPEAKSLSLNGKTASELTDLLLEDLSETPLN